jgi:HPt (histidine-containing phosphotransfer) domain-containing protein
MESDTNTDQPDLSAALDRLWTRFLPEIRERVAKIESAAQSLGHGELDTEQREAAASAAHKLAGVLGTFSLEHGTALARELELAFSGADAAHPDAAPRLAAKTAELRAVIESRK